MSDAPTTDPEAPAEPDTPTEPTAGTPEPEVDYRKRYEDLRPEYTRATQTLSDEEALIAHIAEKFPHLLDEDDDPEPDPEPTEPQAPQSDPRIDELTAWQQQEQARQAQEQFDKDFKAEIGDREVNAKAREWIELRTVATGNDPDALKAAVQEWFELTTPPAKKPRTPHVPTGGTAPGGPDKPWEDMTPTERDHAMVARLQAEAH